MFKEVRQGILFTLVTMVLLGGGYNVLAVGDWPDGVSVAGRGQPDSPR